MIGPATREPPQPVQFAARYRAGGAHSAAARGQSEVPTLFAGRHLFAGRDTLLEPLVTRAGTPVPSYPGRAATIAARVRAQGW